MVCKTFSRSPTPAKLIGSADIVRSIGITAKKIGEGNISPKRERRAQESGEGSEMRDQRSSKCHRRSDPMPGVKMISGRDLDQFLASWKFVREEMKQIESANNKTRSKACNRGAEKDKQDPKVAARLMGLRQQIEAQANQGHRNCDQRDKTDETVEHNCEQRAGFPVRS